MFQVLWKIWLWYTVYHSICNNSFLLHLKWPDKSCFHSIRIASFKDSKPQTIDICVLSTFQDPQLKGSICILNIYRKTAVLSRTLKYQQYYWSTEYKNCINRVSLMFSICHILVIYFQLIFTFSTYFNNRFVQKRFWRRENMENICTFSFRYKFSSKILLYVRYNFIKKI